MTEKYKLKNYMEEIVLKNLEEQLAKRSDLPKDERFKLDVYAYSLNQVKPHYVVTDKGHIYTKLKEMEMQFNADVTRVVYQSIEFIKERLRK